MLLRANLLCNRIRLALAADCSTGGVDGILLDFMCCGLWRVVNNAKFMRSVCFYCVLYCIKQLVSNLNHE